MIDRILFYMPDDLQSVLAAISVVQSYVAMKQDAHAKNDKMPLPYVSVVCSDCSDLDLQWLLRKVLNVTIAMQPIRRDDYDLVFTFDPVRTYSLSLANQRPMVQTFGLQLGVDAPILPDLSALKTFDAPTRDIFVTSIACDCETLADITEASYTFMRFDALLALSLKDTVNVILDHKLVVAHRCGITYLAAALGRGVVELYPTDKHRRWLSKWSHPDYVMIYANEIDPKMLSRAVRNLWTRMHRRQESVTPMAQKQSDAGNVVGQSSS